MKKSFLVIAAVTAAVLTTAPFSRAQSTDPTLISTTDHPVHLIHDIPAENPDGTINAVIEIPAGTNEKWEVSEQTGQPGLEYRHNRPRVIAYLGYPGNYGMIPRTLLAEEFGGDGDPLDVLVIGGPLHRGDIAPVRLIGVLKFLDNGEQDDKLLAVLPDSALAQAQNPDDLETRFPGALDIIRIWFEHYKGPGTMVFQGTGSADEARRILETAMSYYQTLSSH